MDSNVFQKKVLDFYSEKARDLPWRKTYDPYKILLSEIMLQQTQVPRVLIKYTSWLKKFPNFKSVANASIQEILEEWTGLGYNRRAIAFKNTCEIVVRDYNGELPKELEVLISLPGIGPYTAGAVRAFAWNIPEVFIETNIRSVFIHFFFKDQDAVHDKEIIPLIKKTLDSNNPREWYYALMDYGASLKAVSNPSRKSSHYTRQSPFKGSNREQRSLILRVIMDRKKATLNAIKKSSIEINQEKIEMNLSALVQEGFLEKIKGVYHIKQ